MLEPWAKAEEREDWGSRLCRHKNLYKGCVWNVASKMRPRRIFGEDVRLWFWSISKLFIQDKIWQLLWKIQTSCWTELHLPFLAISTKSKTHPWSKDFSDFTFIWQAGSSGATQRLIFWDSSLTYSSLWTAEIIARLTKHALPLWQEAFKSPLSALSWAR